MEGGMVRGVVRAEGDDGRERRSGDGDGDCMVWYVVRWSLFVCMDICLLERDDWVVLEGEGKGA